MNSIMKLGALTGVAVLLAACQAPERIEAQDEASGATGELGQEVTPQENQGLGKYGEAEVKSPPKLNNRSGVSNLEERSSSQGGRLRSEPPPRSLELPTSEKPQEQELGSSEGSQLNGGEPKSESGPAESGPVVDDRSVSDSDQGSTYTVEKGDTLWDIAERHYGDGSRWKDILEANPEIEDPKMIREGQEIVLPNP